MERSILNERLRPAVVATVAGVASGILAERADTTNQWTSQVASQGGIWLLAALAIGVLSASSKDSMVNAAVYFLGVVAGYYGLTIATFGEANGQLIVFWSAMAVTGAPIVAWGSYDAKTGGAKGIALVALAVGGLVAEAFYIATEQRNREKWGPVTVDVIGATIGIIWLGRNHRNPRTWLLVGAGLGLAWAFLALIRLLT